MSQNILTTISCIGKVKVTAGWDHSLHEIFCNVIAHNIHRIEQEDYPACLLRTSFSTVQDIVESLKQAQIALPQQMIDAIQRDCDNDARNMVRIFNFDGTIQNQPELPIDSKS